MSHFFGLKFEWHYSVILSYSAQIQYCNSSPAILSKKNKKTKEKEKKEVVSGICLHLFKRIVFHKYYVFTHPPWAIDC